MTAKESKKVSVSESEEMPGTSPKPWSITTMGGDVIVCDGSGREVATMGGVAESCVPDARLMSAAPDLLVALVELMESEGGEPRKHDIESARTWRLCESALMKASQKHESAQIARAVEARARNRQMAREARKAAKGR